MLTISRRDLRRRIGSPVIGAVKGATTLTMTDAELMDRATTETEYVRAYCLQATGVHAGTVRRVTAFNPANGQLTLAREWPIPALGVEYELHTMVHPDIIHRAINAALGTCTFLSRASAFAAAPNEVPLNMLVGLTYPSQVVDVYWRAPGESGAPLTPLVWFGVTADFVLRTKPPTAVGQEVLIDYVSPYGSLTTDIQTTTCPAEWVVQGALVDIYGHIAERATAEDVRRYERLQHKAALSFRRLSTAYTPRPSRRVQLPERGL